MEPQRTIRILLIRKIYKKMKIQKKKFGDYGTKKYEEHIQNQNIHTKLVYTLRESE